MVRYQRIKMLRLAYVVVYPFPDLIRPVSLEAHPHLKAAETPRLLEAVHVILIALMRSIEFVCKIRGLETKRSGEAAIILCQDRACIERRVKPLVGINGDRIRELQPLASHRPFMGEQHAATVCGVHVQ